MMDNTPAKRHLLPGLASALMKTPVADEAQLLVDLGQFVADAEASLGAVFLQVGRPDKPDQFQNSSQTVGSRVSGLGGVGCLQGHPSSNGQQAVS